MTTKLAGTKFRLSDEFTVSGESVISVSDSAISTALFTQAGTGAQARSVESKLRETVSVRDFGAVGDGVTDDTAAIQAAIDSGAAEVMLPAGTYKLTSALTVTAAPVTIAGAGIGRSFLVQAGSSAGGIYFNFTTYQVGGSVRDLSIHAGSLFNTTVGSTGSGIRLRKANGGFSVTRVDVQAFAIGIQVAESYYAKFSDFQVLYARDYGVLCDSPGAGSSSAGIFFERGKVSNFGFTGNNSASVGIGVLQSAGDYFDTIDVTTFNTAVRVKPSGSDLVAYLFMDKVLADSSLNDGWDIDGTSAAITEVECANCWAGFQTGGHGVRVRGTVESFSWEGGRVRENGKHGFFLEAGGNLRIANAKIARNSKSDTNVYDGIYVGASVSSVQIVNNRIGNFASGLTHQQANGIGIHASFAGRIQIQSNDLTGPGTAKSGIANPSAVQPLMSGNFPLQAGYNPELGRTVALATAATVAAATTTYLGVNAEQGTEAATFIMVAQKGAVTQLQFQVVAAPGAGKTFTYTLRKNGQDTALAGEISGDAAYVVTAYGAVAVDPGDYLSVKLVTASGAAATLHRGYLSISG